jgi:hypothetical protein
LLTFSTTHALIDRLSVSAVCVVPWMVVCTFARCTTSLRSVSPFLNLYFRSYFSPCVPDGWGPGDFCSGSSAPERAHETEIPTKATVAAKTFHITRILSKIVARA